MTKIFVKFYNWKKAFFKNCHFIFLGCPSYRRAFPPQKTSSTSKHKISSRSVWTEACIVFSIRIRILFIACRSGFDMVDITSCKGFAKVHYVVNITFQRPYQNSWKTKISYFHAKFYLFFRHSCAYSSCQFFLLLRLRIIRVNCGQVIN
jgi:hypothetical protein